MKKNILKTKKVSIKKKDMKGAGGCCSIGCSFFLFIVICLSFCSTDGEYNDVTDKKLKTETNYCSDSLIISSISETYKINDIDSLIAARKKFSNSIQNCSINKRKQYLVTIDSIIDSMIITKVNSFFNNKAFDSALNTLVLIDSLNSSHKQNDSLRYIKAMSLKKLGKNKEAAEYLYYLHDKSERLEKLENKLNPSKKIFSHYQALCYDGWFMDWTASRKGTCSRHGGVKNWNGKAIYHTKRKYEF